ncbi:uncharacterized protein C8Q71DRAFT_853049 [Rhodofomes roseus]|uniref:HMG box domain-containing protein n=1 Tax=Rhodofomes roseus TaxID=34475 RepID=A0ABQ8KUL1_9APHY|nr:uncharacterized protein C8Q71DRAFT_853049 [Rhodofomes roseus]KAH9842501.1 hypothetical protein C8Q71DRAFT_853049 [Rhodofomes roseus]
MQRQPYYRTHSQQKSTSERRAQRNRERDPSWVPRPPNAFIIFRVEYSRKHAQANRDRAPTPEKTLSKRAAEAWKALSAQEKAPYKQRAEQERLDHAERHPHYRYKPRRHQDDGQAGTVAISRREQVESLLRRTANRSKSASSGSESASDYTSPSSPASVDYSSSSPEPPTTPYHDDSPAAFVRHGGRSTSMPSRSDAPLHHHFQRSLLLSGCSAASMHIQQPSVPTGVKQEFASEPASPYDISPFAWPIEPLDAGFNLWSSDLSAGLAQSPSSMQSASDVYALEDTNIPSQGIAIPQEVRPPASTANASSSCPTSTGPLLRRRRAATASGALPSPLTVVSSSLAHWNTVPVPTMAVSGPGPTAESVSGAPMPTQPYAPAGYMQSWPSEAFTSTEGLAVPASEIDFDRTPRSSEFPMNARAPYVPPTTQLIGVPFGSVGTAYAGQVTRPMNAGAGSYSDMQAELESYTMGLAELGIQSNTPSMSPFGELDINEFFNFDADVNAQG